MANYRIVCEMSKTETIHIRLKNNDFTVVELASITYDQDFFHVQINKLNGQREDYQVDLDSAIRHMPRNVQIFAEECRVKKEREMFTPEAGVPIRNATYASENTGWDNPSKSTIGRECSYTIYELPHVAKTEAEMLRAWKSRTTSNWAAAKTVMYTDVVTGTIHTPSTQTPPTMPNGIDPDEIDSIMKSVNNSILESVKYNADARKIYGSNSTHRKSPLEDLVDDVFRRNSRIF